MRRPLPPARRNIQIGRLDLDLRGIASNTADAAARALGPALTRALQERSASGARNAEVGIGNIRKSWGRSADRIDAARIESPASPDVHDLAARIARRIADALEREEP